MQPLQLFHAVMWLTRGERLPEEVPAAGFPFTRG